MIIAALFLGDTANTCLCSKTVLDRLETVDAQGGQPRHLRLRI
jgi:hypothetical protein